MTRQRDILFLGWKTRKTKSRLEGEGKGVRRDVLDRWPLPSSLGPVAHKTLPITVVYSRSLSVCAKRSGGSRRVPPHTHSSTPRASNNDSFHVGPSTTVVVFCPTVPESLRKGSQVVRSPFY